MQESTASRPLGVDDTRPSWPGAVSRPDPRPAPQPEPLRESNGVADAPRPKDATFPRSYARFEMNKDTNRLSIKIVDAATDEVIREIPSDEVQRIAYELQALARRASIGTRRPGGTGGQPGGTAGGVDRYV
jgi:flagellar protein FlaG